jgi:hypothetical protein
MSDSVTDKTKGFPIEHNRVQAAAASIDVAKETCERIGVAS